MNDNPEKLIKRSSMQLNYFISVNKAFTSKLNYCFIFFILKNQVHQMIVVDREETEKEERRMVNEYEKWAEEKKRIEEERREIKEAKLNVIEDFERMDTLKKFHDQCFEEIDRRLTEDLWIGSVATLCGDQQH